MEEGGVAGEGGENGEDDEGGEGEPARGQGSPGNGLGRRHQFPRQVRSSHNSLKKITNTTVRRTKYSLVHDA